MKELIELEEIIEEISNTFYVKNRQVRELNKKFCEFKKKLSLMDKPVKGDKE